MKKLFLVLVILSFGISAYADDWCGWSGTEGTDCRSDYRGYIVLPNGLPVAIDEANLNDNHGYYKLITTQPVLGENQVRDAEVWGFADNKITKTWTVRDMTVSEIDTRTAGPMPLSEYYLWKALITTGVITQQQAVQHLPQQLIDAYQARDRLENPE